MPPADNADNPEPVDQHPSGGPPERPRSAPTPVFIVLLAVVIVMAIGSLAYLTVGPGHMTRHCQEAQVGTGRC